jgi:hypothetical protein
MSMGIREELVPSLVPINSDSFGQSNCKDFERVSEMTIGDEMSFVL